ncbi:MAG: hypothetical protein JWM90_1135 [Thermoleophilia bacterium]|nr:hypothetical protein [Thermoleophilia bacterium]
MQCRQCHERVGGSWVETKSIVANRTYSDPHPYGDQTEHTIVDAGVFCSETCAAASLTALADGRAKAYQDKYGHLDAL